MRLSRAGVWLWAVVVWLVTSSTASTSSPEARQIFKALNAVRVDRAQVYYVRDLHLRKDAIRLSFVEGKLALLEATEGRVTGAVFTGTGRVIAVPRDPVERRSLAWFLGTPLLDQPFTRAYLRFTDGTAAQVLAQIRAANGQPIESAPADSFAEDWNPTVANLNSWHSLRILLDWLSSEPRPYLYAGLAGASVGPFDVLVDDRREEQVMIGQSRLGKGGHDYDIWASFPSAAGGTSPRANASENYLPSFSAISYSVSTTIRPEMILEGQTKVRMRARRDGERVATMELSRFLSVRGVVDGRGRSLEFFQNETLETQAIAEHGSDDLYVVLPEASREGEEIQLSITYQGRVISDAGNDIYLVGERGGWYPSLGGRSPETSGFAVFDLTFRWPRRLTLAATGKRGEIREEGEWRIGRWQTEMPVPKAGFHLGEYVTHPVNNENFNVEVYTTRQLAEALHMGEEVADSIRFYEKYHGSFPFSTLAVSPIPGVASPETSGREVRGWPGLLYIQGSSLLAAAAQTRAGMAQPTQEQLNELPPFHEVAHQWWGHTVGSASYRDYWIQEAMAGYFSLLHADNQHPDGRFLANSLERFRNDLVAKELEQETRDEAGPLMLGPRLRSSKTAGAYAHILYGKGPWIIHMLRMMLHDPKAKDPDARFRQLIGGLVESHRHRALTTMDLQRAVEKLMTPEMDLEGNRSMEWFFDQWVRDTGIPRYSVTFEVKPKDQGFLVTGTLKQEGVPETFTAAVPLYVVRTTGKPMLLGTVVTSGTETAFQFNASLRPQRLLIDPNRTLLCVTE